MKRTGAVDSLADTQRLSRKKEKTLCFVRGGLVKSRKSGKISTESMTTKTNADNFIDKTKANNRKAYTYPLQTTVEKKAVEALSENSLRMTMNRTKRERERERDRKKGS